MDRGHRPDRLVLARSVAAAVLLAVALALGGWAQLLRFSPDDGYEFEQRTDLMHRLCAGVEQGVASGLHPRGALRKGQRTFGECDASRAYAGLKRREAVPWLRPAIIAGLAGLGLAWSRTWLRAVALAVGLYVGIIAVNVLRAPT